MIRPRPLKKGDNIGLIGTSSPTPKERIKLAIEAMEKLGLNVILGESCKSAYGFLSGSDELRAKDINMMFKDKTINGIFAIRGGYGCARLLNMIDYENIKKNPKIFAGYSDVTALHIAFNQKCKLITFHTPMPATEFYHGVDEYTMEYFKKNIFSNKHLGRLENALSGGDMKSLVGGKAKGRLVGGNLSIVVSLLSTPYELNTKGKILFLEDVDEVPYKIDRMLLQLKQSGKFRDASGIILGEWTNCKASEGCSSLSLIEIFNELIASENKPTIYNVSCGHCVPTMSLPLGEEVFIDGDKSKIIF